jgi:xanthine dehydrogenase small subunit
MSIGLTGPFAASSWQGGRCGMRDHLQFHLNGEHVTVSGDDAFLTLSDFLRQRRRLTGTKVVCAEGDCGSCSVLVGRSVDGTMRYAAVTSCIALVLQLDGTHVVSIEGLKDDGRLNPIQQAMVKCHGAQCGFCTPGFVVSLYQMANDRIANTRENATRCLVGNLCRCTGYDSILRAATEVSFDSVKPLDALYPSTTFADDDDDVLIETTTHRVYKPATLEQALTYRQEHPTCSIVSGATDLGVLVNKRVRTLTDVLALGGLTALRNIDVDAQHIHIGAAATLTEVEAVVNEHLPSLGEFLAWFGSPPIKNAGTLGGNLGTGSPIGDSIPALMVMNADVELASVQGRRRVGLITFYTGYRQSVMRPDELIVAIHLPRLQANETLKLYKVSKRKDLDISSVSVALWLKRRGDIIEDIRLAAGGVGPMVMRLANAQDVLRGGPLTLEQFERAARAARDEIKPIGDVRGSAEYRKTLVGNCLIKACHELMDGESIQRSAT